MSEVASNHKAITEDLTKFWSPWNNLVNYYLVESFISSTQNWAQWLGERYYWMNSLFSSFLGWKFDTLSFVGVRPLVNFQTKINSYQPDISLSQDFMLDNIPFN